MRKTRLLGLAALSFVFILSGCAARTYQATRDRLDQDLSTGNRGYLMGKAPASEQAVTHKSTRDVRVVEIELGFPSKVKKAKTAESSMDQSAMTEATAPVETPVAMQQYTVGKSDTLQKISKKFYGTTKKWYKIYQANKDVLKGPDKIYPGQVINIPLESEAQTVPSESLK